MFAVAEAGFAPQPIRLLPFVLTTVYLACLNGAFHVRICTARPKRTTRFLAYALNGESPVRLKKSGRISG